MRFAPLTDEDILSLKEAAAYLRLSENTLRRAIKEGVLPAAQLRGKIRIRKADLDALFKKQPPEQKTDGEED
jgi:excisionase family DNA binding protein